MSKTSVDINPNILKWARIRARYDEHSLAKKVGVGSDTYLKWESGESKPSLRQLFNITRKLNQPLQIFFMSEPPDEPEALAEMRRLPGSQVGSETPEFAAQIHLVMERLDIALRLYTELAKVPPKLELTFDLHDNPEKVAASVRDAIDVNITKQASWENYYDAIREWRSALEAIGVLVFQIPDVGMDEMRGFSFALQPLPIIGVNIQDAPPGRIFTLFHEFTHILLKESVLDSGGQDWYQTNNGFEVERFCNEVAGAILIPVEDIFAQAKKLVKSERETWNDPEVISLSKRYRVSRAVIIRRLRSLQLISRNSFNDLSEKYDVFEPRQPGGGGNPYANKIAHLGTLIPNLAFQAYYGERLTTSDLSLLLGLKAEHLGKLEQKVTGFTYGFLGG